MTDRRDVTSTFDPDARCIICEQPFADEDDWNARHTPVFHPCSEAHDSCCPDCNPARVGRAGKHWLVLYMDRVVGRHSALGPAMDQAVRMNDFDPIDLADDDQPPPWPDTLTDELKVLSEPGKLVTGRFAQFSPDMGVPVRTTVGAPRFWRKDDKGELVYASEIAPYGVFKNPRLDTVEVRRVAYRARLDDHAVPLVHKLAGIAADHPGQRLVLLCYENVNKGEECHRRWFANWFEGRFGITIPELPA